MLMGAPRLADGSNSLILEPRTNWTQTMMTCASATRASVKTAKFMANGTRLEDVRVLEVFNKIYPDISMPLWAIERTNLSIGKYSPLWGLIDDKYEDSEALQTRRKQSLWLPAGQLFKSGQFLSLYDSTPTGAHLLALSAAYDIDSSFQPDQAIRDYSGGNDFGLYVRWRDLSRSSETAGKIINLIWTDIMANLVVGTKPGPFSSEETLGSSYDRVVRPWKRRVVYDLRYAIPAFVMFALWLGVLLGSLLFVIRSRVSLSTLTHLANQLAPGRMAVNFLKSDACRSDAPTKEWATKAGSLIIGFELDGNEQSNGDNVAATLQNAGFENTQDLDKLNDLRMAIVADASGDGRSVPVSAILALRREALSSSGPTPTSKEKPGSESSSLLRGAAMSNSEPGSEGPALKSDVNSSESGGPGDGKHEGTRLGQKKSI